MRGTITKALSGFYYVETEKGTFQCRARGIFKKREQSPLVGDEVDIEILDDEDGVVNEIFPRKNAFIRPPISNIDSFVVMSSIKDPSPNFEIIDRFLINAEKANVDSILCINKIDLIEDEEELEEKVSEIREIYGDIYPLVFMSVKKNIGVEELRKLISKKKVAFAGSSGIGKTSLLNILDEDIDEEVGKVSRKTRRGKHTTRHVEMYDLGDTIVYDTPGFTAFEAEDIEPADLDSLFPEMQECECKFDNCAHIAEPQCGVKAAVENGEISPSRYASYVKMYNEIKTKLEEEHK